MTHWGIVLSLEDMRIFFVVGVHDPHSVVWRSDQTTEFGSTCPPSHTRARCRARWCSASSVGVRCASFWRCLIFATRLRADLTMYSSGRLAGTESCIMPSRWLAEMVFLRRDEVISRISSPSTSITEEVRPPERVWIFLRSICMFAPYAFGLRCSLVLSA